MTKRQRARRDDRIRTCWRGGKDRHEIARLANTSLATVDRVTRELREAQVRVLKTIVLAQYAGYGRSTQTVAALTNVKQRRVYDWVRAAGLIRGRSEANRIAWQRKRAAP